MSERASDEPLIAGVPFLHCFVNGFIIVIVANVPQGLPATVTCLMFIAARRLSARNVLVKETSIIESLGSCTVIASDKTGTLTQNVMRVEHMFYGRTVFQARSWRAAFVQIDHILLFLSEYCSRFDTTCLRCLKMIYLRPG